MNLPDIAIFNFSNLNDQEVQDAIRAVNRQVIEDFLPIWGCGRLARLLAASYSPGDEGSLMEESVQADSAIYLVNEGTLQDALGYHSMNTKEVPVGFVYVNPGDWTITLSHEVLELIVDPSVNIFVPGQDPRYPDDPDAWLWHAYEACDAVESTSYAIDGVEVSNFLTPQYFAEGDAAGTRNDFLGAGVTSFNLLAGCHIGAINPLNSEWEEIQAASVQGAEGRDANSRRFRMAARGIVNQKSPKPLRPSDAIFAELIETYNRCHPGKCRELPELRGISRTGRYRAVSQQRRDQLARKR